MAVIFWGGGEYFRNSTVLQELRKYPEKLVIAVNLGAIWFEFWMKGALATVETSVFFVCWFSNQFDIVLDTLFSCNEVGSELWLAIHEWKFGRARNAVGTQAAGECFHSS